DRAAPLGTVRHAQAATRAGAAVDRLDQLAGAGKDIRAVAARSRCRRGRRGRRGRRRGRQADGRIETSRLGGLASVRAAVTGAAAIAAVYTVILEIDPRGAVPLPVTSTPTRTGGRRRCGTGIAGTDPRRRR